MKNQSDKTQVALLEITIRLQAQNYHLRLGSVGGWIALILIVGIRVALYFIKGAH